jgi:hypothetical protein
VRWRSGETILFGIFLEYQSLVCTCSLSHFVSWATISARFSQPAYLTQIPLKHKAKIVHREAQTFYRKKQSLVSPVRLPLAFTIRRGRKTITGKVLDAALAVANNRPMLPTGIGAFGRRGAMCKR